MKLHAQSHIVESVAKTAHLVVWPHNRMWSRYIATFWKCVPERLWVSAPRSTTHTDAGFIVLKLTKIVDDYMRCIL
jgi:hypothetical protein